MFSKSTYFALSLLALLLLAPGGAARGQAAAVNQVKAPSAANSPLASVFAGDDGGAYYVTEVGQKVYWFAEHPGRDYAHVFVGTRDGDTIKGRFYSVPKDRGTAHGQVTLRVNPNGTMERVGETGGFPSKSFRVVSIHGIVDKLPNKREWPGFTANTLDDLDGVFDGAVYRYYVRQVNDTVVFFTEKGFAKGQRPDAAFVFVGERQGPSVKGQLVAVPKGKKTGHGPLSLTLNPDRSLTRHDSPLIGGAGPLQPVLPDIAVPIRSVMELLNTQLNKLKIHLDGHASGNNPLQNGSYINFGGVQSDPFTLPYYNGSVYRYFINDMESDVIHITPVGGNESRLTVVFETGGREIKRVDEHFKRAGDKLARDWDIENPRCDIYFRLVNYLTADAKPSISYEVTRVSFGGEIDAPGLIESIDDFITRKVRPIVETNVKKTLNNDVPRKEVAGLVRSQFDGLVKGADNYRIFGYSISGIAPKGFSIDGDKLVFRFH